jgi:peptide deformylase
MNPIMPADHLPVPTARHWLRSRCADRVRAAGEGLMSDERAGGGMATGGTARPITRYGESVLHRPCATVSPDQPDVAALVADMFASMYAADGIGLAANQIGVSLRVFVIDCPDGDGANVVAVVVNPVLHLPESRELVESSEGCLSVPGVHSVLARPNEATVRGTGLTGEPVEIVGTGLLARCLQHECDHLAGTVYVDRLSRRARKDALAAANLAGVERG